MLIKVGIGVNRWKIAINLQHEKQCSLANRKNYYNSQILCININSLNKVDKELLTEHVHMTQWLVCLDGKRSSLVKVSPGW